MGYGMFSSNTEKYSQTQKRQLFKKSLKTTNRLLALKKARIWWLKMEENDFQWEVAAETLNECSGRNGFHSSIPYYSH